MSGKFLIIILGIMALTILPEVVILGLYATHWSFWWQMVYMLTITVICQVLHLHLKCIH